MYILQRKESQQCSTSCHSSPVRPLADAEWRSGADPGGAGPRLKGTGLRSRVEAIQSFPHSLPNKRDLPKKITKFAFEIANGSLFWTCCVCFFLYQIKDSPCAGTKQVSTVCIVIKCGPILNPVGLWITTQEENISAHCNNHHGTWLRTAVIHPFFT